MDAIHCSKYTDIFIINLKALCVESTFFLLFARPKTMFITKYFSAFNEMDENHDGQVSEEEFIEVILLSDSEHILLFVFKLG